MTRRSGLAVVAAAAILGAALFAGPAAGHGEPTCEGALGTNLVVHGQHIIGDYVTGVGGLSGTLAWPPAGLVGDAMRAKEDKGVAVAGGPGPGFHFTIPGLAPGASFCNPQAHPNGFTTPPAPSIG